MFSERELKEASAEVVRAMAEHLPEPGACPAHAFSEEFERKMEKAGRRTEPGLFQKGLQAAACTAVVLLTTAGVVLAVNTEVRAEFFGWVQALSGQFFHYQFVGEENSSDSLYHLGWEPSGYTFRKRVENGSLTILIYENESGESLAFSYQPSGDAYLAEDGLCRHQVFVGGVPADFYVSENGGDCALVWVKDSTLFVISGRLTEDVLIKIAENVT